MVKALIKTNVNKIGGELAIGRLSPKAREGYSQTPSIRVYEYHDQDKKLYAFEWGRVWEQDITLDDLEVFLVGFYLEEDEQ